MLFAWRQALFGVAATLAATGAKTCFDASSAFFRKRLFYALYDTWCPSVKHQIGSS